MENEKMPSDGAHPWGLHVPGRPVTPSEGVAYQYNRVGPEGTQKIKTFDNGTCIEFGPEDPVDEFEPGDPFFDQVAHVDRSIRDCSAGRQRYEGIRRSQASTGQSVEEDPFDNFRTLALVDTYEHTIGRTIIGGHAYTQIPSKYASCTTLVSIYSVPNKSGLPGEANIGPSSDYRWGLSGKEVFNTLPQRGADPPGRGRYSSAKELQQSSSRGDHGGGGGWGDRNMGGNFRGGFYNDRNYFSNRGGHGHQRVPTTAGQLEGDGNIDHGYEDMTIVPYGAPQMLGYGSNDFVLPSNASGSGYDNFVVVPHGNAINAYQNFTVVPHGRANDPAYTTPPLSNVPLVQPPGPPKMTTHPRKQFKVNRGDDTRGRGGRPMYGQNNHNLESDEEDNTPYGHPEAVYFERQAALERAEETRKRKAEHAPDTAALLRDDAPRRTSSQQSTGFQGRFLPNPEATPYQYVGRGKELVIDRPPSSSWNSTFLPNGQYVQQPIPQPGQGAIVYHNDNGDHSKQSFGTPMTHIGGMQSFDQDEIQMGGFEGRRLDVPRSNSVEYTQRCSFGQQGSSRSGSTRPPSAQLRSPETGVPLRSDTASTGRIHVKLHQPSHYPRVRGTGPQPDDGTGHRVPLPNPFSSQWPVTSADALPVTITAATPDRIRAPDRSKAIQGLRKYQPTPDHPHSTHKLIAPNGMIFRPRELMKPEGKQKLLNILNSGSSNSSSSRGSTPHFDVDLQSLEPGHAPHFRQSMSAMSIQGMQGHYGPALRQMSHSAEVSHGRADSCGSDMSIQTQFRPANDKSLRPAKITRTNSGNLMSPRKEFIAGPSSTISSHRPGSSVEGIHMSHDIRNYSDYHQGASIAPGRGREPSTLADDMLQQKLAEIESKIQPKQYGLDKLASILAVESSQHKIAWSSMSSAPQSQVSLPGLAASSSMNSTPNAMDHDNTFSNEHQAYSAPRQEEIMTHNAELKKTTNAYKSAKVAVPMLKPPGADSQMARDFSPLTIGSLRGIGSTLVGTTPSRSVTPVELNAAVDTSNAPPTRQTPPFNGEEILPPVNKTRRRHFEL